MAVIHRTTMVPTKLELLARWLPRQPWYRGGPGASSPAKAGGYRVDDPAGEVGVEVMFLSAGGVLHQVPLGYRGAPLEGAEAGFLGTSEHGVLGTRWIYDGAYDPLVAGRLLALAQGEVQAQHQDRSHEPDPSVRALAGEERAVVDVPAPVPSSADTVTSVDLGPAAGGGRVVVDLPRVLGQALSTVTGATTLGQVEAGWRGPSDADERGVVVRALLVR